MDLPISPVGGVVVAVAASFCDCRRRPNFTQQPLKPRRTLTEKVVDQVDTFPLVLTRNRRAFVYVVLTNVARETRGAPAVTMETGSAIETKYVIADIHGTLATTETRRTAAASGAAVACAAILATDEVVANSDVTVNTGVVRWAKAFPRSKTRTSIQANLTIRLT